MAARKYPWESWFGKKKTVILRGRDYNISQSSMYQSILSNASKRKVKVRIEDVTTGFVINMVNLPAPVGSPVGNGDADASSPSPNTPPVFS